MEAGRQWCLRAVAGGLTAGLVAGGGVVRRGKLRRRIVNYRLRGNAFLTPDLGSLHVKYFQHHPGNFIITYNSGYRNKQVAKLPNKSAIKDLLQQFAEITGAKPFI